jgi:hypothetical protein
MSKVTAHVGAKQLRTFAFFLLLASVFFSLAYAESLSQTAITGTWDTKEIAMITNGEARAKYAINPGSFVYTFTDDGKWVMQSKKTKHSGKYLLKASELILKNNDGSTYQDWQADLRSNGTNLLLKTDTMSFLLDKTKSNH